MKKLKAAPKSSKWTVNDAEVAYVLNNDKHLLK